MKETASQKACVNWVARKMSLELCIPTWVSPGSKQVSAMLLSLQKINSSLCARFAMHCLRNQPFLISCIFLCLQIKEVIFCLFLPIDFCSLLCKSACNTKPQISNTQDLSRFLKFLSVLAALINSSSSELLEKSGD